MNERPQALEHRRLRRGYALAWGCAGLAAALTLAACTRGVRARRYDPKPTGFLRDYSKLQAREGYEARLIYINASAVWPKYDAIMIDSVTLWVNEGDKGRLTEEEQQRLTDYLYAALHDQLSKHFVITDRPGPGVIRIRAALTEATGANVPLRIVTTAVPQLNVATTVVGMSADTAYVVGAATVEAEAVGSISGERLAAVVDNRAGTKSIGGQTFEKLGDVQAAANFWAERTAATFVRLGVRQKQAAPPA